MFSYSELNVIDQKSFLLHLSLKKSFERKKISIVINSPLFSWLIKNFKKLFPVYKLFFFFFFNVGPPKEDIFPWTPSKSCFFSHCTLFSNLYSKAFAITVFLPANIEGVHHKPNKSDPALYYTNSDKRFISERLMHHTSMGFDPPFTEGAEFTE